MHSEKAQKALALHAAGSACSQAVFTVFAKDFGLDEGLAHRLSGGLGGGIGRTGQTCGALSGGVLALSLAFGAASSADQDAKLKTYEVTKRFLDKMTARFGSTQCKVLLRGADLWTQSGRDKVKAEGLSDTVCNPLIAETVEYVEKAIAGRG